MRSRKHICLPLLALAVLSAVQVYPQALSLRVDGDHLQLTTPQLQFLTGRTVERLRNGATIPLVIAITITPGQTGKSDLLLKERFSISFDIWEEKFTVIQSKPGGRTASHMTSEMAEKWCFDKIRIPTGAIPSRKAFMLKLECYTDENTGSDDGDNQPGLTLAGLIDIFSRKQQQESLRLTITSGPFLLESLKGTQESR